MCRIRAADGPDEVASSADVATRLQVLAQDHREGRLSLEAYRKLRAALLDTLDSGRRSRRWFRSVVMAAAGGLLRRR